MAPLVMRLWPLVTLFGALLALAAVWRFTPARDLADVEIMQRWFGAIRGSGWELGVVLAVYLVGSMVLVPITLMITATGLVFGLWPGFGYALAGSLLTATAIFGIGRLVGQRTIRRLPENAVKRVSRQLRRHGILAAAMLGMLPLAPFTVSNLVAGVSGVRLRDFIIGTLIGTAPGMLLLTALGSRMQRVLRDPSLQDAMIAAGMLVIWIAVAIMLQYLVGKRTES